MSKQTEFIKLVVPGAQEVQRQTGMFASVTISQAAWETGWGSHTPKDKDTGRESYNLFGRKARTGDDFVMALTWEVYNYVPANCVRWEKRTDGKFKVWIHAPFKVFDSYVDSILDRSSFLKLAWYQRACNATDPFDAARFLIDTGYPGLSYATDPDYVKGVSSNMRNYNLTQYDLPKGVIEEEEDMAKPMVLPDWRWRMMYDYVGQAYNDGLVEWSWCKQIIDRKMTGEDYSFLVSIIEAKRRGQTLSASTKIPGWGE